jgi:hypothetical protein
MTKTLTLTVAFVALAAAGIAASTTSIAGTLGASPLAMEQVLGHGNERGECGKGDRDMDGDRC